MIKTTYLFKTLTVLALSVIAFSSCDKDDDPEPIVVNEDYEVVVKFEGIEKADTTITFAWNEDKDDKDAILEKLGDLDVEGYEWVFENNVVTYSVKMLKVTFDFGGIRENVEVEVEYGKSAVAPSDVEVEGYTFDGWNGKFENVTSDNVVYAKYVAVTLDINGVTYTYTGHKDTYTTKGFEFEGTSNGIKHTYIVVDLNAKDARENLFIVENGNVVPMTKIYEDDWGVAYMRYPEADTANAFGYISDGVIETFSPRL